MGFKLLAISTWLLTVSAFSVEKKPAGSGCIDLLCPDTAFNAGIQKLVNEDTANTDACTSCEQCTENGYSVCLRLKDSRASRTAGGCSCSHHVSANCHNDLTQTVHPANLTMKLHTVCYTDVLQKPSKPLGLNEKSSVLVTIEPFWLEPYWKHLKVEDLKLHYSFLVDVPEHCDGEVETTPNGVHTCVASTLVDPSTDGVEQGKTENDDYEHSENYKEYDDELPPEVAFDRDIFGNAKNFEAYFTATVRRPRQLKIGAPKSQQIYDSESQIESEHLKFDLKPEVYGVGKFEEEKKVEVNTSNVESTTTSTIQQTTTTAKAAVTEMELEKDESATSEELGGTNFFEEDVKKEEKEGDTVDKEEEEDDEGVAHVNLEDIEPTKLKSQEDAAKKKEEEENVEEKSEELEVTTAKGSSASKENEKEGKEEKEEKDQEEKEEVGETTTEGSEVEEEKDGEEEKKSGENEENEDSEETSTSDTVELVEGEGENGSDEESEEKDKEGSFLTRITDSFDFPRVRLVFLITLAAFIGFIFVVLCLFYREKYCCCKKKESKNANGYRYTNANAPTELKPISRAHSSGTGSEENRLLSDDTEVLDNFRSVVRSGTTFNPNKVELGISVGMGKFGPIYRAMFNSYNGSVHDVNIYLLKNVTRLPDEQLNNLTSLLKSNVAAGAHPNVVSLCGISQAGPDVMLMWEPLHQPTLQGVLRESRCARFGSEPFNFASFLSSERLATMAIGCCTGLDHLLKKNVYPTHISTSNVLVAERGIVKIGGFGLAEHHALNMSSENAPTRLRWMPPEYFKRDSKMVLNEQTMIWPLGVVLWEIFSLGGTPFSTQRQVQSFIDSMRDGSAKLEDITYCGEAVTQLLATCTSHTPEARADIKTIIRRLECISADAKAQINLCYRDDFPYLPIVTQLEQQTE